MRLSRLVTKERIREALEESLDNAYGLGGLDSEEDMLNDMTDGIYELMSELDTVDDLGIQTVTEEEGTTNA